MSQELKFEVIIYWSTEDECFVAEASAFENMDIVIDEWIDTAKELGRPTPGPNGILMYA